MSVEGERFIKPSQIIRDSGPHPKGAKISLVSLRKHGEGLVVQYTVRVPDTDKEYYVGVINSRGQFAGSMLVK